MLESTYPSSLGDAKPFQIAFQHFCSNDWLCPVPTFVCCIPAVWYKPTERLGACKRTASSSKQVPTRTQEVSWLGDTDQVTNSLKKHRAPFGFSSTFMHDVCVISRTKLLRKGCKAQRLATAIGCLHECSKEVIPIALRVATPHRPT